MTPSAVAQILARQFNNLDGELSIIDAGAGVGSLTTALIARGIDEFAPTSIVSNTWELEPVLVEHLHQSLSLNQSLCNESQIDFNSNVHSVDFIESAVNILQARARGGKIDKKLYAEAIRKLEAIEKLCDQTSKAAAFLAIDNVEAASKQLQFIINAKL